MEVIAFTKTKLPFGWLGNMSPFPIEYQGKTWRTAEALFQALRFEDEEIQEEIRAEKSPMAAKFVAKRNVGEMTIKQLSEEDVENMRVVVRLKIEQHSGLKEDLLATGNDVIIENCTKRGKRGSNLFWGAVLEDGEWLGKNVLGNIWMELREEIKAERAKTLGIDPTK
jgi:ribA/ribD-fused uncharacterized protein